MCGFIAQLVERASHRYRGGHGFKSRRSLDFFRLRFSSCLNWKISCMIILHFVETLMGTGKEGTNDGTGETYTFAQVHGI